MSLESQAEDLEKLARDARLAHQTAVAEDRRLWEEYTLAHEELERLNFERIDAVGRAEKAWIRALPRTRDRGSLSRRMILKMAARGFEEVEEYQE